MGIRVIMITGDNARTAEAIRRQSGVDEVLAQAMPEDKESRIAELQAQGHTVAMIGDGINDAPALARADIGIAIGAGTDIALDSADVVLVRSDLMDAVTTLRLGRAVIRNIRQNLFWAFFYNCIGIPLAAGIFYPLLGWKLDPMFGAAAMSLSSVCVVTNALRLRRFRGSRTETAKTMPVLTASLSENADKEKTASNSQQTAQSVRHALLHIEGMMCGHCSARVTKALENAGASATVSHENGTARVDAAESIPLATLSKAVEDAGYHVQSIEEIR
jgi:cation transport ATPase